MILVVDDDEMVGALVCTLLQSWGHQALSAQSGEAALEKFSSDPPPVRAVITDIVMQGMNGIELADRLHRINPDLPVVFMSGFIGSASLGSCTVLNKPFTPEELRKAIEPLCTGVAGS